MPKTPQALTTIFAHSMYDHHMKSIAVVYTTVVATAGLSARRRIQLQALICAVCWVSSVQIAHAQVEHVPVVHPVYQTLMRWEAQKILPADFSSSVLPLQRKEIVAALQSARQHDSLLAEVDKSTLARFEREFGIAPQSRSTVFVSPTDSTQVLVSRLVSDDDKFLYVQRSQWLTVNVVPLVALDGRLYSRVLNSAATSGGSAETALMADVGGRVFGTIDSALGFFLQGTNGALIAGNRASPNLTNDARLRHNLTWRLYTEGNSGNFDFSESHVRFDHRWFYAGLGRETRLIGSGYNSRLLFSDNAPVADALMLGGKFSGFEYRFMHLSLLGEPEPNPNSYGAGTEIPSKFMAYHRLAFRGTWGEVGISEQVLYSRRGVELPYLLPVSFLRSVSNALRDRDNLQMALDATFRPLAGVQFKGTFVLDDVIFDRIGTGWWSNKWAWNAAVMLSPVFVPFDATLEYTRVQPYTFSHFDRQNAATHDGFLFAGHVPPNADELAAQVRWWYGNRYPVVFSAVWRRHGQNIVNPNGDLVRNVGGSPLQTLRYRFDPQTGVRTALDAETVTFLDGDLEQRLTLGVSAGWEITRQWNLQVRYHVTVANALPHHALALVLRFEDF